jgi:hypothetical protein
MPGRPLETRRGRLHQAHVAGHDGDLVVHHGPLRLTQPDRENLVDVLVRNRNSTKVVSSSMKPIVPGASTRINLELPQ